MANYPNCGSDHIHLKADTSVNWGRAVAGWALFGSVGLESERMIAEAERDFRNQLDLFMANNTL